MTGYSFAFCGTEMTARGSGALWWDAERLLAVSDLHFGKSLRLARQGGPMLPPYELRDTLARLEAEIEALRPARVVCLGDSFDDLAATESFAESDLLWLARLQAGRDWVWIAGNHDPAPLEIPGTHQRDLNLGGLVFRHIPETGAAGEIAGHFHPKARLAGRGGAVTRPCFLQDRARIILPAFGTYTGGLRSEDAALQTLMGPEALAILTGPCPLVLPMPR